MAEWSIFDNVNWLYLLKSMKQSEMSKFFGWFLAQMTLEDRNAPMCIENFKSSLRKKRVDIKLHYRR